MSAEDLAAAQSAAALENLLVQVYNRLTASGGPLAPDAEAAGTSDAGAAGAAGAAGTSGLGALVAAARAHHAAHADAFNTAVQQLGGRRQDQADEVLRSSLVLPALQGRPGRDQAVELAIRLEEVAAQTYAERTATVSDAGLRATFARTCGVENQHRAVLRAALVTGGGSAGGGAGGPTLDLLPPTLGGAVFPDSFLRTDSARPATEAPAG